MKNTLILMTATMIMLTTACRNKTPKETAEPAMPAIDTAWDAITPAQRTRLRRAAEGFIAKTNWRGDARFDAILVCGLRIHWARGAL